MLSALNMHFDEYFNWLSQCRHFTRDAIFRYHITGMPVFFPLPLVIAGKQPNIAGELPEKVNALYSNNHANTGKLQAKICGVPVVAGNILRFGGARNFPSMGSKTLLHL